MKRIGNLYDQITSMSNLLAADKKAQQGKAAQYGVVLHNRNKESNLLVLQDMLISKTFRTSPYDIFKIYEPKERVVYRLPYFPDRIVHCNKCMSRSGLDNINEQQCLAQLGSVSVETKTL